MTRLHPIAIAITLGLTMPSIATILMPQPAAAQQLKTAASQLQGTFLSGDWTIGIYYRNNVYNYAARDPAGRSISLSGATIRRDGARKIYTWNNGGTRYQAIWKPQDPDFIRVRVTTPQGKQVFDRLLRRAAGNDS